MADDDPNARRIALAVSCRDSDVIPKVPDAGAVRDGVQVMHNGVLVEQDGYQGPWMTEIIRQLQGHHEPQEELAFHLVLERLAATSSAPVVVELGSWWAYYSLWARHRIPAARSVCVEPDPAYLEQGKRNFALNGLDATFHHAAVGHGPTPPRPFACESDGRTHDVPFEGLASLLDRFDIDRADLVLVDVQGAETPLLDGGRDLLRDGRVRFMIISTHHELISGDLLTHHRCVTLLRELGAHIIVEHTVAESFTGDGLIVASFDERDRDLEIKLSRCRVSESLFGDQLWEVVALREQLADARRHVANIEATPVWKLRNRVNRLLRRG